MWFDHHTGNVAELELRGIDVKTIPGRFAPAPSCVRVVYDFLREQGKPAQAEPLYRDGLDLCRKVTPEDAEPSVASVSKWQGAMKEFKIWMLLTATFFASFIFALAIGLIICVYWLR